jgi:glycosyltransferase involved in cell wall biosynthesis
MDTQAPLVTIGIPAYNRAVLLKRAIESALNQDYSNVEVIVSDNASTDDTESVCRQYEAADARFKYIKQASNMGPRANFIEVLDKASGRYFMWLGDDDWIDRDYIKLCVRQLISDPAMALASGAPHYYRSGVKLYSGKVFSLMQNPWWLRVVAYYKNVSDNGMFYGLMPTGVIRSVEIPHTIGGDWLMLANIVSIGKARMLPETSVHRELGGMTDSVKKIARITGLPNIQAMFPYLFAACCAWVDIVIKNRRGRLYTRCFVAMAVFLIIISKSSIGYFIAAFKRLKKIIHAG